MCKVYCKDCKYYQPVRISKSVASDCESAKCLHPENKEIVSSTYEFLLCTPEELNYDNKCGYYEKLKWKFWVKEK